MNNTPAVAANTPLAHALSLAEAGYLVFPCTNFPNEPEKDKKPLIKNGFKGATKDPAQIREWWTKFPDALVGMPTGALTGIFVVDDDTAKKPDAASSAWLATLPPTRTHSTRSGGKHLLYMQPAGVATKSKVGIEFDGAKLKSVDTRGDGGYIIWWAAHGYAAEGNHYTPMPPSLKPQVAPKTTARIASPEDFNAEKLRRALACISPPCKPGYGDWIEVGQALHHASGGSDDGLALWDEWSAGKLTPQQPDNYEGEGDCAKHWGSFGKNKTGPVVTVATLFFKAKQNGYLGDMADKFGKSALPPGASLVPIVPESAPLPEPKALTNPIVFRHITEILARKSHTEWLPGLNEILERKVIAFLVAQRDTLKSFVFLEWCMRAAVAGAGVVILSGEGGGLDRRMEAWRRKHGKVVDVSTLKLHALERPVNLNDAGTLKLVADALDALGWSVDLFGVDTLSKFTPGLEENDNTGNAQFLTALSDVIRYERMATVLIVAHAGHGEPGRPRGASTLMANPDAEYIADRRDLFVRVSRERFKDYPSLPHLCYQGEVIDLGYVDENLRPVTSLAFTAAAVGPQTAQPLTILSGNQKLAWDALKPLLVPSEDAPPCVPAGRGCLGHAAAMDVLKIKFKGNVKPSRAASNAIDDLVEKSYLARDDGWLWTMNTKAGV